MPLIKTVRFCPPLVDPKELETYLLDALAALSIQDSQTAKAILQDLKDQIDEVIY